MQKDPNQSEIDFILSSRKKNVRYKQIGKAIGKSGAAVGQQFRRYQKKIEFQDPQEIEKIESIKFKIIRNIPSQKDPLVSVKRFGHKTVEIADIKEITMELMLNYEFEENIFNLAKTCCCPKSCSSDLKKELWTEIRSNFIKFKVDEQNAVIRGIKVEKHYSKMGNYTEQYPLGILDLCNQVFQLLFARAPTEIQFLSVNESNDIPENYLDLLRRLAPNNTNFESPINMEMEIDQKQIQMLTCNETKQLYYNPVFDNNGRTFEKLDENNKMTPNLDKKQQVIDFVLSFYKNYHANSFAFKTLKNMFLFIQWSFKDIESTSLTKMKSLTFLIKYYESELYNTKSHNFDAFVNWSHSVIDSNDFEFQESCIWFLVGMYTFQNNLDQANTVVQHSNDLKKAILFYKGYDMKEELVTFIGSKTFSFEAVVDGMW